MNSIPEKNSDGQVEFYDLIIELIKDFLENFLKAELTEFLNYEKHDYSGRNSGNSRNGAYLRDFLTKFGNIKDLNVPRDRNSEFQTELFQPYKCYDNWLEEAIINIYANGLPTRYIGWLDRANVQTKI